MEMFPEQARSCVYRLVKHFGAGVFQIPLFFFDGNPRLVAYTGINGIGLNRSLLRTDPSRLDKYVMHEIFHDVVSDVHLTHRFSAEIMNYAEDYKINQLGDVLYGHNFKARPHPGLRDKRYDKLSLKALATHLTKIPLPKTMLKLSQKPGVNHTLHPALQNLVAKLRLELSQTPLGKSIGITPLHEVVILSDDEQQVYFNVMSSAHKKFVFDQLPNVEPMLLVQGLFGRLHSMYPAYNRSVIGAKLTQTQALVLGPSLAKYDFAIGDPQFAMSTALRLVTKLNSARDVIKSLIYHQGDRLQKLYDRQSDIRYKLKDLKASKNVSPVLKSVRTDRFLLRLEALKASIQHAHERITMLDELPAFIDVLKTAPLVTSYSTSGRTPSLAVKIRSELSRPSFQHTHILIRMCNLIINNELKRMAVVKELTDSIDDEFPEMGEEDPDEPEEASPEDDIDDTPTKKDKEAPQATDEDEGDEDEPEDASSGSGGSPQDGDGDNADPDTDATGSGGEADDDQSDEEPSDLNVDGSAGEGKGQGSQSGVSHKLKVIDELAANPSLFRAILRAAHDFGEKLTSASSRKENPNGLLDRSLTNGNDLSRVTQSDLGRLGNKLTKLSFLADLANGNLLQYVDIDPRRSPVVLLLDASGSMMSDGFYVMAVGFCLALIRKLQDAKRGVVLIMFASGIDHVMVWDKMEQVPLLTLLRTVATPSSGGTVFDTALRAGYKQIADRHWNQAQVLLVSDGGGCISPEVAMEKPKNVTLTAVLVDRNAHIEGADMEIHTKLQGTELSLISAGRAVL